MNININENMKSKIDRLNRASTRLQFLKESGELKTLPGNLTLIL